MPTPLYIDKGATLSRDQRYRYALWRAWTSPVAHPALLTMVVVGLNPSTADASMDDPTIRRCVGFAQREGCTALAMVNLFAFRATNPRDLRAAADMIGPLNNDTLSDWLPQAHVLVCAWGALASRAEVARAAMLTNVMRVWRLAPRCFGLTRGGFPRHPLYLRGDAPLVPFVDAEAPHA
jgi:hypothetical protein